LKVSCTIADLDGKSDISPEHISEAIQYRTFYRALWVWDSAACEHQTWGRRGVSSRAARFWFFRNLRLRPST